MNYFKLKSILNNQNKTLLGYKDQAMIEFDCFHYLKYSQTTIRAYDLEVFK